MSRRRVGLVFGILVFVLLVGMFGAVLNVPVVKASGTIYIRADGSIDLPTAPISTLDNITYTFTANIYDSIVVERDNIIIDGNGYTLQGSGTLHSKGINLTGRSNVTIKNMEIKTFDDGIELWSSNYNSICGNNITNNYGHGIYLEYSSDNSISGNKITNNGHEFWGSGIVLVHSSNNSVVGNNITNDIEGITLWESSGNTISGNNITNSSEYGICLDASSNYNSISGNNITNNRAYGIYLSYSSNNEFYHNDFIDNTQQVNISSAVPSLANVWDDGYPSGGNYWSDYNGTDANHDGIGDTPYIIDANNTDNYPLMTPYVIPEFPSFLIMLLFMIATLLAIMVCKKRSPSK
jgi:parallel beta-helix repeat protein